MRKLILAAPLAILAASFVIVAAVQAPTGSSPESTDDDGLVRVIEGVEFVGSAKCKTCHRKPESGEQYPKWEEGPHSKAYMTLASDEAKAIAAERGIENPQESAECLQCHVTAFDAPAELLGSKYSVEEGVGCESCHGAGGNYYKKSTMKSITAGEIEGSSVGLVAPDETLCTGCHNENSPTFKAFNFEEFSAKIAHPIPEETKAAYQ